MVLFKVGLELVDTFRLTVENGFHLQLITGEHTQESRLQIETKGEKYLDKIGRTFSIPLFSLVCLQGA